MIIVIIFWVLVWMATLFTMDIELTFDDGSRLSLKGWTNPLRKWISKKMEDYKNRKNIRPESETKLGLWAFTIFMLAGAIYASFFI